MLNKDHILVTLRQNHMATTFDLTLSVPARSEKRAESCLLEALHSIAILESQLSEFIPTSEIYQLNEAAPRQPVRLNDSTLELIEMSAQLEASTAGAFSIAAKCGMPLSKAIDYSKKEKTAWKRYSDSKISFGAIGKGFALDQIRTQIESWGFSDYLFSAGGSSLIVSGSASRGIPWTIGWSVDGQSIFRALTHHRGHAIACGISGISEQGFHILDPRSNRKALTNLSAFVSHPSATYADALSTALFVLGWTEGLSTLNGLLDKPCLALINSDREVAWNGTFQNAWGTLQ